MNRQNDCASQTFVVEKPTRRLIVFNSFHHRTQVLEANRSAIPIGHDQRFVINRFLKLTTGLNHESLVRTVERPRRQIHIAVLNGGGDFIDSNLTTRQSLGIEFGVNRILLRAIDADLSNAAHH